MADKWVGLSGIAIWLHVCWRSQVQIPLYIHHLGYKCMLNKHTVTRFVSRVGELNVHPIVRRAFYKNQLACFRFPKTTSTSPSLFSLIKTTKIAERQGMWQQLNWCAAMRVGDKTGASLLTGQAASVLTTSGCTVLAWPILMTSQSPLKVCVFVCVCTQGGRVTHPPQGQPGSSHRSSSGAAERERGEQGSAC